MVWIRWLLGFKGGLDKGWQNASIDSVYADQWQKIIFASFCKHKIV